MDRLEQIDNLRFELEYLRTKRGNVTPEEREKIDIRIMDIKTTLDCLCDI